MDLKKSTIYTQETYTVVWEKFTVGYFRVKIVCGETLSSLGGIQRKVFNNEVF